MSDDKTPPQHQDIESEVSFRDTVGVVILGIVTLVLLAQLIRTQRRLEETLREVASQRPGEVRRTV